MIQVYIFKVFEQLFNVRQVLKQVNRVIGESSEMLEILDEAHEIVDHSDALLDVNAGKIAFTDVTFAYADGRAIFDTLNLRIQSGEKVAIVGQS